MCWNFRAQKFFISFFSGTDPFRYPCWWPCFETVEVYPNIENSTDFKFVFLCDLFFTLSLLCIVAWNRKYPHLNSIDVNYILKCFNYLVHLVNNLLHIEHFQALSNISYTVIRKMHSILGGSLNFLWNVQLRIYFSY